MRLDPGARAALLQRVALRPCAEVPCCVLPSGSHVTPNNASDPSVLERAHDIATSDDACRRVVLLVVTRAGYIFFDASRATRNSVINDTKTQTRPTVSPISDHHYPRSQNAENASRSPRRTPSRWAGPLLVYVGLARLQDAS